MARIQNFKQLQDEVLGWLDEVTNEATTRDNVKAALNAAHLARLTQQDWNFMLWPTPLTFTPAAGTLQYSLHSEFHKPFYFFNQTTKAYLTETNPRQLGPSGVRWNTHTGPASRFQIRGVSPVASQPAAAAVITVVSDSAADTSQVLRVEGTDSAGTYRIFEEFTLNGTSTVTGSKTFSNPILSLSLSAVTAGNVTVTCGATTLIVLTPGEIARSYPQLYLLNNPTSTSVVEYLFYRQPRKLEDDSDVPDIPPPYQSIIVFDALILMAAYNEDINGNHIRIWTEKRTELENAMLTWDEGNSIEAEPRYVRTTDNDEDNFYPAVYR